MREPRNVPWRGTTMSNQYVIQSALRTLQLLLVFGKPPHRFTLSELMRDTDVERNQLYRSLKTLEAAGFLAADDDGRFGLTRAVNLLSAGVADRRASLVEVAAPHLDALAAETGEHVNLFALASDHAICIDRRESVHLVRLGSIVGQAVALHAGAVPKAMLAFLDDGRRERVLARLAELPSYTPTTQHDETALRRELDAIRARGYSISDEDFDASARGVGAPIFDDSQQVVGGVSVGGPSFRVGPQDLTRLGSLIVRTAKAISQGLGCPA